MLFVHAFAEEMNKSRRMAALQSRRLAEAGCAVLQIDLLGCGDSSGDFADATWDAWLADLRLGSDWLREEVVGRSAPLVLWGHRAGCLLACQAQQTWARDAGLLLWQPPASGRAVWQQFMRLKLAAEMSNGKGRPLSRDNAPVESPSALPIEIAGYRVQPALSDGLRAATLAAPPPGAAAARVAWLEVTPQEQAELLPASRATIEQWRAAGHHVHSTVVRGPTFWQTQEIEDAPAMLDATVLSLEHLL